MKRLRYYLLSLLLAATVLLTGCCSTHPPIGRTDSAIYVPNRADDVNPIMTGQMMPEMTLLSEDSTAFDLTAAMSEQPTVLVFYRGGWCPYCTKHLDQLQEIHPELIADGYQLIAVSPDRPEKLLARKEHSPIDFTLLSDSDMQAAISLGIAFRMAGPLVNTYRTQYKIDL
ncbi:peroxiredoxin family protein, partial [bacterium]|nr:peroxiredoxin family protein [bacterium]